MNLSHLKYAVEVANCGSINKAAENLFVGQPSLSRSIKELEESLNIEIFSRSAKGMELTPDGEIFIKYAKSILKQVDDVENLFSHNSVPKKKFSISVPRASYMGKAFAEFSKTLNYENDVELLYKETNSSKTFKNILEGEYRLGIVRYAENYDRFYKQYFEEKGLSNELIAKFKYVLLMNKDNPMSELDEIRYDDLENYIEIAHADPFVPSVPLASVKKEELPDNIRRRIFVFERASQLEILSTNTEAFMWVSPTSPEVLKKNGLIEKRCADNNRVYKDVMIYKKDYNLSKLDKDFITELTKAKREILEKE